MLALVFFAMTSVASANDSCGPEHCAGGHCFEERGVPYCLCGPGFAADGLSCVPAEGDRLLRSSEAVALGERVVQIAMDQYGRELGEIGRGWTVPPYDLAAHVRPNEWWCTDFVVWVYAAAGLPLTGGGAGGWHITGNEGAEVWFRENTVFIDRDHPDWDTFVPRAGDYVRFWTPRSGHSAIVRYVEGDRLYTVEGNFDSEVRVNRYDDYKNMRQLVGFGIPMLDNDPPSVSAFAEPSVTWPEAALLDAELSDDGGVERLRPAWRLVDGSGQAIFEDPTVARTQVTFSAPGVYRFALDVDDGDLFETSELVIEAVSPPAPIVEATPASCATAGGGGAISLGLFVVAVIVRRRR
jgi:uncharacterized protein (TIGR03382 family)